MPLISEQQTENSTSVKGTNPTSAAPAKQRSAGTFSEALSSLSSSPDAFEGDVRALATALGGEYLFGLPASGLVKDCQRIAAIKLPREADDGFQTEFVLLEKDGETVRARKDSDSLKELDKFAHAFVDVLGQIGPLAGRSGTEAKSTN